MGLYSSFFFPRFYDWVVDKPHWTKYRVAQLADVRGEVLEIGVGTGLNLPHYPKHVRKITTVDPNPGMNRMLEKRILQTGIEVDKRIIGSESLPFEDGVFDFVVSTITMCSIPNLEQAVRELYRILKPGGRLSFLEHGISPDRSVRKWQHRLNWLQQRVADGCRLDVDIPSVLRAQPFTSVEVDNFYMEKTPKPQGYMYRGTAVR